MKLFKEFHYTEKESVEIPSILLTHFPKEWPNIANTLPINTKKSLFFKLLLPSALMANEEVIQRREKLLSLLKKLKTQSTLDPQEAFWLRNLALQYQVLKSSRNLLMPPMLEELKKRVDIVPTSLLLAQGAIESGWGTSRFTIEGNALFGQWSFSSQSIKPKRQRKAIGNYGLARFKTPQESIRAYIHNLNTHLAYRAFRDLRATLRAEGKPLEGKSLAVTLLYYSERGESYIQELLHIIDANHLNRFDHVRLAKHPVIIIQPDP